MKMKLLLTILLYLTCQVSTNCCTVFSIQQGENVYVGNNEDWYIPYPRYRIIPGAGAHYGRIIFSFENNWGQGGMNEKGLFFDTILQPEESNWKTNPLKKDWQGSLSEKILAECTSVEEALKYFQIYNEPTFKTSLITLVDSSGQSAFVSWEEDKLTINTCKGRCVAGYRSDKVVEKFKEIKGTINKNEMSQLLNVAHQEGEYPTLYSNLYDLKNGLIHLYYFHNYEEELVLNLQEEIKKGYHIVELKDIFKTQIPEKDLEQLKKKYIMAEVKSMPLNGWFVIASLGCILLLVGYVVYFFISKQ